MEKQKQNSLKENGLHIYTVRQKQNKTNNNGKWKVKTQFKNPKTPDRKKQGIQNENGSSGWLLTVQRWSSNKGGDQQVVYKQRTLVIHKTKWENKDSKHNRMTWMKLSASKQHTHKNMTHLWNPKFGFANLNLWNYLWHNYYMHVDMLKESLTFALETGFWK